MIEGIQVVSSIQKKTLFTAIIVRVFIGRTAKNLYLYDMETALENLSKEDLIKVISSRDEALAERDKK
ncbi:hypothetical protein Lbys_1037 [Leadbetterella byssophila DSM 17132]|uniref:Uncharacterized protein n=2 Tax=Leadbetterella TaxID=319458 RepID=E4RSB4_LEAB4|nr:hypothetical protein Lbys_1037 [Leadbetterella byssophila DSM 17132]